MKVMVQYSHLWSRAIVHIWKRGKTVIDCLIEGREFCAGARGGLGKVPAFMIGKVTVVES